MGSFFDPGSKLIGSVFGDSAGSLHNRIVDPMDIFGIAAGETQDEMDYILRQSAMDAITSQEEMRQINKGLLAPYQQGGVNALSSLERMATNGPVSMQTSPEYSFQRDEGLRNINRGLSARGLTNSHYGGKQAAGFLGQLGQEEANRQYLRTLDPVKMGLGALSSVGQANAMAGQNVGGIYGNLGSTLNDSMYNYGQQRQDSFNSLGTTLGGAASYIAGTPSYQPTYTGGNDYFAGSDWGDWQGV